MSNKNVLHKFRGTLTFNAVVVDDHIRSVLGNDKFTELAKVPDPDGRFLLHDEFIEKQPNEFLITELIKYFPDRAERRNHGGEIPLHCACWNVEYIEPGLFVVLLKAYRLGPTIANNLGNLPLHKVVAVSSVEAGGNDLFSLKQRNIMKRITMIMEAYPEALSIKNIEGQIPLHIALTRPKSVSLSVVSMLLEYYPEGAMDADKYGDLPLHKSVSTNKRSKCCPQAIEMLIDVFPEGAAHANKKGFLPLHWVVIHERPHLEILSMLLAAYPQGTQIRDIMGLKPIDILYKHEHHCRDAANMLIETAERVRRGDIDQEHPLPEGVNFSNVLTEVNEEEEEQD